MAPSPGDHREERVRGLIEPDVNVSVVGHAALLVRCIGFVAAVLALVIVTLASAGAVNALHHWFIG